MTLLEALRAAVTIPALDEMVFEKALLDNNLNPADTYTAGFKGHIDTAAIQVLKQAKQLSRFAEGDLSFQVNETAIDEAIAEIQGEEPPAMQQPTIRNASKWW